MARHVRKDPEKKIYATAMRRGFRVRRCQPAPGYKMPEGTYEIGPFEDGHRWVAYPGTVIITDEGPMCGLTLDEVWAFLNSPETYRRPLWYGCVDEGEVMGLKPYRNVPGHEPFRWRNWRSPPVGP